MQHEIVLPQTRPETEWLRGRAVRKMSPQRDHAVLKKWWLIRLDVWAAGRGEVAAEWRFRVAPPGEAVRPLVPDVSYLSYERMRGATVEEIQTPLMAPDIAVEIRSPGDNRRDVEAKVDVLVRAGTGLVIVVNPKTRTVVAEDTSLRRIFSVGETFEHPSLPGFTFALAEMFDALQLNHPN